jgi:hypothetical protein
MNLQKWLSVANDKKALRRSPRGAEIERRARFDYDDLPGLFSFQSRGSRGLVLLNISIFVGQILLFSRASSSSRRQRHGRHSAGGNSLPRSPT